MYLLLRGHPERWGRRATADHDRLTNADSQGFKAVSYTHLDVYKRQA